jgi:hypothetical protein
MILLLAVVGGLVIWALSRRFHRKGVEHEANVVAQQPLTEFAARFPRSPQTRGPRRRRLPGGF